MPPQKRLLRKWYAATEHRAGVRCGDSAWEHQVTEYVHIALLAC